MTARVEGNRIASISIALGGVDATPVRASSAEALLYDAQPSASAFAAAAQSAAAAVSPASGLHATAAYRRHLVGVLVRRALAAAIPQQMAQT